MNKMKVIHALVFAACVNLVFCPKSAAEQLEGRIACSLWYQQFPNVGLMKLQFHWLGILEQVKNFYAKYEQCRQLYPLKTHVETWGDIYSYANNGTACPITYTMAPPIQNSNSVSQLPAAFWKDFLKGNTNRKTNPTHPNNCFDIVLFKVFKAQHDYDARKSTAGFSCETALTCN